ncbi:hypothetical protein [Adhaeribacter soli]|uniref:Uncharacterized protein n=1 Tax=Adhaeribacter soli TaxID=2607655 RepID=A0A5N1J614_9BACT|nr:hypothetical protein [Adhaeribacter soli]KAA9346130.1 hypothetical protein F0P94_03340 [Adhaeribacter soli]
MDFRLYDPFVNMTFSSHACFLCGTIVSDDERIPVFSGWLQKRYDLGQKKLQLLDQSTLTFTEMQIPCCPVCAEKVAELDQKVEAASKTGLPGLQALEEKTLFLWLARMFYGILVTELKTEQNPLIKPEYSVGENPKMLHKFQSFFQLMQAIRVPIEFDDFTPCSIFMVELQQGEQKTEFNYRDDLTTMMFSLQLDNVLIIANLLDNGFLKKAMTPVWREVEGKVLHPIQAAEFSARVYYAAYIFNLTPDYFVRRQKPEDTHLIYDTLVDDITATIFNPWEHSVYATALEKFWLPWQISRNQILQNPESPLSFLLDAEGRFRELQEWEVPVI